MNDHLCEKCGAIKVFVGSLLAGRLECPECTDAEMLAENIELARLKSEEFEHDDAMLVDANIKRLNGALSELNDRFKPVQHRWVDLPDLHYTKLELFDSDGNLLVIITLCGGESARGGKINLGSGSGEAVRSGLAAECVVSSPFGPVSTKVCRLEENIPGAFVMDSPYVTAGCTVWVFDVMVEMVT